MEKYIKASLVPPKILERDDFYLGWNACIDEVNKLPSEDVVPVSKAHNITLNDKSKEFICSECNLILVDFLEKHIEDGRWFSFSRFEFRYCPNCGAKISDVKEVVSCLTE